ncbi:MAG: hypothetical protein FWC30_01225 [Candidatus Bathyarchaeota archaeon]|nr:hypothetical protein [Candidatus Termiticorpusculum sp.]
MDRYVWYDELLELHAMIATYNDWHEYRTTYGQTLTKDKDQELQTKLDEIEQDLIGNAVEDVPDQRCTIDVCSLKNICSENKKSVTGRFHCLIAKMSITGCSDLVRKNFFHRIFYGGK